MTAWYIAETDEQGDVSCVWVSAPDYQLPRVFDPAVNRFDPNAPAEYFGAGVAAIMAWLAARQIEYASFPLPQI